MAAVKSILPPSCASVPDVGGRNRSRGFGISIGAGTCVIGAITLCVAALTSSLPAAAAALAIVVVAAIILEITERFTSG